MSDEILFRMEGRARGDVIHLRRSNLYSEATLRLETEYPYLTDAEALRLAIALIQATPGATGGTVLGEQSDSWVDLFGDLVMAYANKGEGGVELSDEKKVALGLALIRAAGQR